MTIQNENTMPKEFIVHVSKENLTNYDFRSIFDCAINRAVSQMFPGCRIIAGGWHFYVDRIIYSIPPILCKGPISMALKNGTIKPFWFRARRVE